MHNKALETLKQRALFCVYISLDFCQGKEECLILLASNPLAYSLNLCFLLDFHFFSFLSSHIVEVENCGSSRKRSSLILKTDL